MELYANRTPGRLDYPVGGNMKAAKELVDRYLELFYQLEYAPEIRINLWCRGSSGAILATIFALNCKNYCKLIHVRKEYETSHGDSYPIKDNSINIIIDDFVSSGSTIEAIVTRMKREYTSDIENFKIDVIMAIHSNIISLEILEKTKHIIY